MHGWTLVTRADRRFKCKRCHAKFYINLAGDLTAGDPPRPTQPRRGEFDLLGLVARAWWRLPWPARIPAVFAVAAVLVAAAWWLLTSGVTLPDGLTARAKFVGDAFARNDAKRLAAISAPGTSDLAVKWLKAVRSNRWNDVGVADRPVAIDVETITQNHTARFALVQAHVVAAPASDEGESGDPEHDVECSLDLFWVLSKDGD
jgi:hypothetical protein